VPRSQIFGQDATHHTAGATAFLPEQAEQSWVPVERRRIQYVGPPRAMIAKIGGIW